MDKEIIGREYEQKLLKGICDEREARLVAVYGRRRVGKTYLIKKFFNEKFDFFFTGLFETPMSVQLTLFSKTLEEYSGVEQRHQRTGLMLFLPFVTICLPFIRNR